MTNPRVRLYSFFLAFTFFLLTSGSAMAVTRNPQKIFPEPRSDEALVYFVRKPHLFAALRTMFVYANEHSVGVVDNSTYTSAFLKPGRYLIWSNWVQLQREYEFLPGQIYYVSLIPEIELMNETYGKAVLEKEVAAMAVPTEKEKAKALQIGQKRFGKAQKFNNKHSGQLSQEEYAKLGLSTPTAVASPTPSPVTSASVPADSVPTPPAPSAPAPSSGPFSVDAANIPPSDPSSLLPDGLIKLPAYSKVKVKLLQNVTTFHSQPGEIIPMETSEDVAVDGKIVIPRGTSLNAVVVMQTKGGSYGKEGEIELKPQSLSVFGVNVPFVGQVITEGVSRENQAAVAGASFGLMGVFAGALIKGKEGFFPMGTEFTVGTGQDVLFPEAAVMATAMGAEPSCGEGNPMATAFPAPVRFAPKTRKKLSDVTVEMDASLPVQSLAITCINKAETVQPIQAYGYVQKGNKRHYLFRGWDLMKNLPFANESKQNFEIQLYGSDMGGQHYVSSVVLPVTINKK